MVSCLERNDSCYVLLLQDVSENSSGTAKCNFINHFEHVKFVFIGMCFFGVVNACFTYREFAIEGDLVGVPHKRYQPGQSFITRLKLV